MLLLNFFNKKQIQKKFIKIIIKTPAFYSIIFYNVILFNMNTPE